MNLCRYQSIFGAPRSGLRSRFRVFDTSLIDAVPTALLIWFISKKYKKPVIPTTVAVLGAGLLAHRIFCVDTKWLR